MPRILDRIYRRLFPATAQAADQYRAERLREDNQRMQQALEDWNRCDRAAEYLDWTYKNRR